MAWWSYDYLLSLLKTSSSLEQVPRFELGIHQTIDRWPNHGTLPLKSVYIENVYYEHIMNTDTGILNKEHAFSI